MQLEQIPVGRLAWTALADYTLGMSSATLVEDFKAFVEFLPVEGRPNAWIIHPKINRPCCRAETEMTPEDWDKFEKDIADAFEQVP